MSEERRQKGVKQNKPDFLSFKNPEEKAHKEKGADEIAQDRHDPGIDRENKQNEKNPPPHGAGEDGLMPGVLFSTRGLEEQHERQDSQNPGGTESHEPHAGILDRSNPYSKGLCKN